MGVIHGLLFIPYGGMVQGMDEKIKKSQLARLGRIEGQVRGVARMIEDERYCIDVLTQIRAVRAALDKVEQETLGDHLKHCVAHAFHAGSEGDRQTKIDELLDGHSAQLRKPARTSLRSGVKKLR
jgi:DNA-binding FrmR family transcriptional regulator